MRLVALYKYYMPSPLPVCDAAESDEIAKSTKMFISFDFTSHFVRVTKFFSVFCSRSNSPKVFNTFCKALDSVSASCNDFSLLEFCVLFRFR